jgi:hypothetical protein
VGEVLPIFIPSFNRSLVIEARPERLSSDAGAVLLRELLQRSGIIPWMVARLADPRASDQVDLPPDRIVARGVGVVWPGPKRVARRHGRMTITCHPSRHSRACWGH